MFTKLLIANRGEIAVRIIRAAHQMGIHTVAVYSDADKDSMPVLLADEAVHIGASALAESYLSMDAIFEAASKTGAEAIHPGYGLLSENALFSKGCKERGLVFVGPSPEVLAICGQKAETRKKARLCGLPVVPGSDDVLDKSQLLEIAEQIGYPVLLKASAGGGGIGMGLAKNARALEKEWDRCQSRAERAFGCGAIYLEAALPSVRHVEIQVISDGYGNYIHAFERECSLQRRHQKVVEESPSPHLSPDLRRQLCDWSLSLCQSIGLVGLGTVEFLVDAQNHAYFIEVNPRLQVEHGITEAVCGVDLVALQLQMAAGEPLRLKQGDLVQKGSAIECRLYAEDPMTGFLPKPGYLEHFSYTSEEGIRVDTALQAPQEIPPFYDPLLAKLIAWGKDREEARLRAIHALKALQFKGLKQNQEFLIQVLQADDFVSDQYNTQWLEAFAQSLRE